ncbi:MAG TPA: hypothetical protein ENH32_01335 [Proteobacteria bacterium]|nr:hypothetical protein [Pseudomonadota bacterium]
MPDKVNYFQARIMMTKATAKFRLAARLRKAGVHDAAERLEIEARALAAICQPVVEARIAESDAILADKEE